MLEYSTTYESQLARLADATAFTVRSVGRWLRQEKQAIVGESVEAKRHGDFVSDADKGADERLRNELSAILPGSGLISEEGSEVKGHGQWRWIVDPLDGTTNYLAGLPHWAVSVALEDRTETSGKEWGRLVLGVIYLPDLDRIYMARVGSGVTRNGHPISPSTLQDPRRATVSHWWPMDSGEPLEGFQQVINQLHPRVGGIRNLGSPAAELCLVAEGTLEGFFASDMEAYDLAAGMLIVEEAGARITDPWGGNPMNSGFPVAGNETVHSLLRDTVKDAFPDKP